MSSLALPVALIRPRTDEQLWTWMKNFLGLRIPRRAVCEDRGHVAPFEFYARAFFADVTAAVALGPRGGGKTYSMAALHHATCVFTRNCWIAHAGSTKDQSDRLRDYVRGFVAEWPWTHLYRRRLSTADVLRYMTGSRLEVLTGSLRSLSGGRPQVASLDEVEFWGWREYMQALNMITSKDDIPGRLLLTSTRQTIYGTMNRVMQAADRTGMPTFTFCVWETMRRCPVGADPTRRGRGCPLFEAQDPQTGLGRCQMRIGGDVRLRCQHDEGHVPPADVIRSFTLGDEESFATQQECARPTRRGLVYRNWNPALHVNAEQAAYRPYLPVYLGADWGWENPTVIGFFQTDGDRVWCFDERVFQYTQIEAIVSAVEQVLAQYGARPVAMFADRARPEYCQAFRERFGIRVNEFDKHRGSESRDGEGRVRHWGGRAEGIDEVRRMLRSASGEVRYWVHPNCRLQIAEYDLYHYREIPGTFDAEGRPLYAEEPEDEDDHAMDMVRYVLTGLAHQRRRGSGVRLGDVLRASPPSPDRRPPDAAPGRPTVRRAEF